ncbi:phosphate acetyltransferase [Treponema primitia]|uniref:phosphate acetyltransferase n=1 Tax=Treponema primitia TaxID=88058 RepID=UPI0002555811|nr:phosphate acetyltransferase [Treponema primitia]
MDFVNDMRQKAKALQKRLVLAEGTEPRTIRAARVILDEKLAASVTLVGKESEIQTVAEKEGVNLGGINIINPQVSPLAGKYAQEYYNLRKHKGMTEEQAKKDMTHFLRWGAMMVHLGDADAMVAGAESATADVLRAGLAIIGTIPGSKTASSCFVVQTTDKAWGVDGTLIFSDCAVVPDPTAEQLADIAVSASQSCKEFLGVDAVVALLSFSTKGSGGDHPNVLKVKTALDLAKAKAPNLIIDGEIQADAALVPAVTDKKAPGSPIKGKVNTLVFPDLGAGNIGYKLVQRLGKAEAFGPFLQGFAKPISDLSRGASVEDIVVTSAVTLARAK